MLRSIVRAAAVAMVFAGVAQAEDDPRLALVAAAIPAEIDGYTRNVEDVIDVQEDDGQLSLARIFISSGGGAGPVVVMVRLWPADEVEDEASRMLDPETLGAMNGKLFEVAGHPAFFIEGASSVFPGRPDSGVAVSIAGLNDADEAARLAGLVDYEALLAIGKP